MLTGLSNDFGECISCKIFGELQYHLEGVGKPLVYNKIVVVISGI